MLQTEEEPKCSKNSKRYPQNEAYCPLGETHDISSNQLVMVSTR